MKVRSSNVTVAPPDAPMDRGAVDPTMAPAAAVVIKARRVTAVMLITPDDRFVG